MFLELVTTLGASTIRDYTIDAHSRLCKHSNNYKSSFCCCIVMHWILSCSTSCTLPRSHLQMVSALAYHSSCHSWRCDFQPSRFCFLAHDARSSSLFESNRSSRPYRKYSRYRRLISCAFSMVLCFGQEVKGRSNSF
jgi:hypothetical protein